MSVESSASIESTANLTLKEVRNRCSELIERGFDSPETSLIEALPVSGKSYGVVEWAAQTGEFLTVLAPRHTLLDEYEERCQEFGLTCWRIPSFHRDCASFIEGDDGGYEPIDDAAKELQKEYEQGFNGVVIHNCNPNASCQSDDCDCPFVAKRESDPSNYDVLLGTYRHAYPEKWIEGRNVAFDEFPGDAYLRTFEDGIEPIVSAYLEDKEDELPFRDWRDFLKEMNSPDVQDKIEAWKNSSNWPYDYTHVRCSQIRMLMRWLRWLLLHPLRRNACQTIGDTPTLDMAG